MRKLGLALALWLQLVACGSARAELPVRDGDLIFQTSRSAQSVAVQRATHSPYSHMGMVVFRGQRAFVLEAAGTVRLTPLERWTDRGVDGRFVVKRLRDAALLTPTAVSTMRAVAQELMGKRYDLTFEWSDERMYCSELVWKLYERALGIRIGDLQRLGDFDLSDDTVRAMLRKRYGDSVPLDEPVISPAAMFHSPLLELVLER